MRIDRTLKLAFAIFSLVSSSMVFGRIIVVNSMDPAAYDLNPGTEQLPLKTIQAGAIMARAGDTILVKGGIYREEVIPPGSGSSGSRPVTYLAAPGENVSIRGSEQITTWEKQNGYMINHNVYLDGALHHRIQDKERVVQRAPSDIRFETEEKGATVSFNLDKSIFESTYSQITAKLIGELAVPKMTIQTPDGEPLDISKDYFGNPVDVSQVVPGPFQDISAGTNTFRLWPKNQTNNY